MELEAGGFKGVGELWGGAYDAPMPVPPRLMALEEFAQEAKQQGAVVYVATQGGMLAGQMKKKKSSSASSSERKGGGEEPEARTEGALQAYFTMHNVNFTGGWGKIRGSLGIALLSSRDRLLRFAEVRDRLRDRIACG